MYCGFILVFGLLLTWQSQADVSTQSMALNCRGCHSLTVPASTVPDLDKLSTEEIVQKLLDFKYGKSNATLMPRIVKGYSDAELKAVADLLGQH